MTRRLALLTLILAALLLAGCSASEATFPPTLATSGTGIVHVTPDMVTVSLGVNTQDSGRLGCGRREQRRCPGDHRRRRAGRRFPRRHPDDLLQRLVAADV